MAFVSDITAIQDEAYCTQPGISVYVINKIIRNQMKNTKYPTVRTISKSNIKTVERGIIDTHNTKTHENSISWLGTGT
jgi:hypothetical protein